MTNFRFRGQEVGGEKVRISLVVEEEVVGSRLKKLFTLASGSAPTATHLISDCHFMTCALSEKRGSPTPISFCGKYRRYSGAFAGNARS